MIDFSKSDYIAAAWFVGGPAGNRSLGMDWMAAVWREAGRWRAMYRFRYYSGTRDPFDDSDRKSWYSLKTDGADEPGLVAAVEYVAQELAAQWGVTVDRVDVAGDQRAFLAKAAGKHWLHLQAHP